MLVGSQGAVVPALWMRAHRLTAHDATYLELGLRRGLPLATNDKALKSAATSVGVLLLGAGT